MNRFRILIHHYLLLSLVLAFISGILLHHAFPRTPQTVIIFSALLLFPALWFHKKKETKATTIFLLLVVVSLGYLHVANFTAKPLQKTHIFSRIIQEEDVVLTGTLESMPLFDGQKSSIIIKTHELRLRNEDDFSPVHGLVQLRLKGSWPKSWPPGSELIIRAKLSRPYRYGNPGGFDYPAFLAAKNILITGRIASPVHIYELEQKQSWLLSLRYLPERIRLLLKDQINTIFQPEQAGIYRALLIGDRSGIDKKVLDAFKASGVMHILAISGIHLSLVASALFLFFYWLARRSEYLMLRFSSKKIALISTIPPLCAYAFLAGTQTPVLRSLIMVLIFILAFCVHRQRSPFTTLSFAALLVLLMNPLSLFTVSFQLSFAAVAALIIILPYLTSWLWQEDSEDKKTQETIFPKIYRWFIVALLVSLTATIGTAPLLIHNFNRLSIIGPITNILVEPLLCLWSLPIGLLSIPCLLLDPSYGEWLLRLGGMGITAAMTITDYFAEFKYSTLWFATPPLFLILLYYLTLALNLLKISWKLTAPLFMLTGSLFFFLPQTIFKYHSKESELVFIDVGQGSSTLIKFPKGKTVLIDGGASSSAKFNAGESIIAPYLWYRGITHLDAIVITHSDADHSNGIPFLLRRFRPDTLWTNGEGGHTQEYEDLLDLAGELNIMIQTPKNSDLLIKEGEAVLQNINNPFLSEEKTPKGNTLFSSNEKSLITRFSDQALSCLFPGDISRNVEKALIEQNSTLQSSILLSPHHGSKTSNSSAFLNTVNPKQIIVSAGRFHPRLFPSPELRSYCETNSIPLLITAKAGAINIRKKNNGYKISQYLDH